MVSPANTPLTISNDTSVISSNTSVIPSAVEGSLANASIENHLSSFRSWLQQHNYSTSTIKNYLVDTNKYLNFVNDPETVYLPETIAAYLSSITTDPNKERYTSSLSKYFQFSLDQKLIASNPIKKIHTDCRERRSAFPTTTETLISQYQSYLVKKKFSSATIKNYLNDVQQFITWGENNPTLSPVILIETKDANSCHPEQCEGSRTKSAFYDLRSRFFTPFRMTNKNESK